MRVVIGRDESFHLMTKPSDVQPTHPKPTLARRTLPAFLSAVLIVAGASPAFAQADKLKVEPDNATVCADGSASFLAKKGDKATTVAWSIDPGQGSIDETSKDYTKYTAPVSHGPTATTGVITLTATLKQAGKDAEAASAQITLAGLCQTRYGGEVVRATLGFEQVGAAGTPSGQKYSFDFFISRPLPVGSHRYARPVEIPANGYLPPITDDEFYFGPGIRWWGDVRIGSYPQQVNSDLATFTKDFATNVGKVQINRLVQSAEFMTGPEVRIGQFTIARDSATEPVRQRYALMLYGGIGSIGPFPPGDDPAVFAVPDAPVGSGAPSAQYNSFHTRYPNVTSKYIAFAPEDHQQFSKQWNVGFRLYTFYADATPTSQPLSKAPASVEIGFGRNALVAPGETTWHASAYYPFALGDRTKAETLIIYFFGDVNMRFGQTTAATPLFLPPALDANNVAIPLTNKDVSIVSVAPNHRDTYRVGVSVDLIRIWNKLSAPTPAK
jgi:hypothetical protein